MPWQVGEGTASSTFDEEFWAKRVDIVMNGLDNMEARLYMDKQCVQHGKGMIDAGTLGAMGNVQVVVPHQSESYGSSADPPEPSIPVCTLKNFPYEISHTIQGGKLYCFSLPHSSPICFGVCFFVANYFLTNGIDCNGTVGA